MNQQVSQDTQQQKTRDQQSPLADWIQNLAKPTLQFVANSAVLGAAIAGLTTNEARQVSDQYKQDLQNLTDGFKELSFDYLKATQRAEAA
jgi:hypothetical protein